MNSPPPWIMRAPWRTCRSYIGVRRSGIVYLLELKIGRLKIGRLEDCLCALQYSICNLQSVICNLSQVVVVVADEVLHLIAQLGRAFTFVGERTSPVAL